MNKKLPKRLYHYCSVESFFNILKSKQIWLSNYCQMNDSHEGIWIEQYFKEIEKIFYERKYKDFRTYTFPTYEWNKGNPFLFCLSEVKDSLSQWRAYADDGKGVAIAFETDKLGIEYSIPGRSVYKDHTFGLVKVDYGSPKQKKFVIDLALSYRNSYDKKEELWKVSSSFLGLTLAKFAMVFKNPSFVQEKEWRIIHTPGDKYEEDEKNSLLSSELKFRVSNSAITSYYELDITEKFGSELIPEIIIGPKSELDSKILLRFLENCGLSNTKIIKSTSTYR